MSTEEPQEHSEVTLTKEDLKDLDNLQKVHEKEDKNGRRLQRNLFVLAISFVFLFTAYGSMANLQSSINKEGGLGAYSLAIVFAVFALASLFVPSLVIPRLGCKWTLIISMVGYVAYVAAQFYPTFFTLIPAAVLLGLCASPLWTAQSMYVTKVGEEYAFVTGQPKDEVLPRFFGLFFLTYQTSQVWGNLIAAKLLAKDEEGEDLDILRDTDHCGRNYCPNSAQPDNSTETAVVDTPDMGKVYILATIFLVTSVAAAVILIFFLDGLDSFTAAATSQNEKQAAEKQSVYTQAIATVKLWRNPYQLLLIPMTLWIGFGQAFISADFTAAFISCAWTVNQIGYVFICYGLCNSVSSFVFGKLVKFVGRPLIFVLSHCFQLGALITMWSWIPSPDSPVPFFAVAGVWGLADGIMNTQSNALNGLIFPHALEAAFSNSKLWISVGYLISYVMVTNVCTIVKIYVMLVMVGASLTGYLLVELGVARQKKNTMDIESPAN